MRPLIAIVAVLVGAAVLPATASAASVTLTSPANGAKFYTGANGSIADAAPLVASRDVSGCLANPDNAYWRVYSIDSQGRTLVVAQSTGPTINISRLWLFAPGVYQIYGEFICAQSNGTQTPIRSDVHTISVLRENPPGGTPPPGGGGGGLPSPVTPFADNTAPVASKVTVSASGVLSFGGKGIVFRWDSSEPTKATLTIERIEKGVTASKCVKARRGRRGGKRCKRYRKVGTLSAPLGTTSLKFNGKLKGRRLKAGKYRTRIVLTDAAGNRSKPIAIGFHVRRR
jgi:hypothetical protein